MIVLAPFLYSLFFTFYLSPVLSAPTPLSEHPYGRRAWWEKDIRHDPRSSNADEQRPVEGGRWRTLQKRFNLKEFTTFTPDFKKIAVTTGFGAVVFGGLAYGFLGGEIKHALGIDKPGYNGPAGGSNSTSAPATHSHYGSGSQSTATTSKTPAGVDSSSDDSETDSSAPPQAIFKGEDLTAWPDQPVSSSSVSRRRVKRSYGTQKLAEVFHGSGKELAMGAGAAAVMVIAMSALGHVLSGKSAAATPAPAGKHSHYNTATSTPAATGDDQGEDQDETAAGIPAAAIGDGGAASQSVEKKKKKTKHQSSNSPPAAAIMKRGLRTHSRRVLTAAQLEGMERGVGAVEKDVLAGGKGLAAAGKEENWFLKKMSNGESVASMTWKAAFGTAIFVLGSALVVYYGNKIATYMGYGNWLSADAFRRRRAKRSIGWEESEPLLTANSEEDEEDAEDEKHRLPSIAKRNVLSEPKHLLRRSAHALKKRFKLNAQTLILGGLGIGGMFAGTWLYDKIKPKKPEAGADASSTGGGAAPASTHSHYSSAATSQAQSAPAQSGDPSSQADQDDSDDQQATPQAQAHKAQAQTDFAGEDLTAWPQ